MWTSHTACIRSPCGAAPSRVVSLMTFGRCTAVAVVEITAHAADTSVLVQTDGSCTTLTDMGQLVPRSLVLDRLAVTRCQDWAGKI